MARAAKDDRFYKGTVYLRRGETVLDTAEAEADSLPKLLHLLFPATDVAQKVQSNGKPRELRFAFAEHGGTWPAPNFHTVARDLRLAPHQYDRLFGPTPGEVAHYVRVVITVADTSAMRAYRNSGFLDDDQIERAVAQLVGTDHDHFAVLQRLYPGLNVDDWQDGISFAQFTRVIERNPETNLWQLIP